MRRLGFSRRAVPGVLLAGLLAGGIGLGVVAEAAPSPTAGPPGIVGTNPAVQQWFKRHEPERIAVNDALGRVNSRMEPVACTALQQASDAMLRALPTPKHALDPQVVAGIAQFRTGAAQCLAGDTTGAAQSIAAGVAARAAAEDELEEILEAPDRSVS
jgi:hypothetical protein